MTNAEQLRAIMSENKLKAADVAELIDVSLASVNAWLVHAGAGRHRPMKNRDLDYLQLKIKSQKSPN